MKNAVNHIKSFVSIFLRSYFYDILEAGYHTLGIIAIVDAIRYIDVKLK